MRHTGLIAFWRDDPHFIGKRARDFFAGGKPRRMNAVVIGDENTHYTFSSWPGLAGHDGLLPEWPSCNPLDLGYPTHIGLQRFRNHDRAFVVLISLHHRDERPAHSNAGAVEGVDVPDALLRAVARIHA